MTRVRVVVAIPLLLVAEGLAAALVRVDRLADRLLGLEGVSHR